MTEPRPPLPGTAAFERQHFPEIRRPANNLALAVLSSVFGFLPLGVVSITFAAQVDARWTTGDAIGARRAAEQSRTFAYWALGVNALLLGAAVMVGAAAVFA